MYASYLFKNFRGTIRDTTVGHGDTTGEYPLQSMAVRLNIPTYALESLQWRPVDNDTRSANETLKDTDSYEPPHIMYYNSSETSR